MTETEDELTGILAEKVLEYRNDPEYLREHIAIRDGEIAALTKRAEQAEAQVRVLRDALTELWQWVGWDEGEEEYRDAVIAGEEGSVSSTIDYTAIRAAAVALATADLADTSANALPEAR